MSVIVSIKAPHQEREGRGEEEEEEEAFIERGKGELLTHMKKSAVTAQMISPMNIKKKPEATARGTCLPSPSTFTRA